MASKYQYLGHQTRTYMDIVIPGEGSLVAAPGDIHSFDESPSDGMWVLVPSKPLKKESEEK